MADTMRIYRKDLTCSDCGKSPVIYVHWGPLTEGEVKHLCGPCMKKKMGNQNGPGAVEGKRVVKVRGLKNTCSKVDQGTDKKICKTGRPFF